MQSATETIREFEYQHLPGPLLNTSKKFAILATEMMEELPNCHEKNKLMDKLLEAKDCAVRAKRWKLQIEAHGRNKMEGRDG